MSILFRDTEESGDQYKQFDILLINKDRKILVNPMEDLDEEEKIAVLTDLVNSDPMQGEFKITDQKWEECRSFLGNPLKEEINEYNCDRFKLKLGTHTKAKKMVRKQFTMSSEDYFNPSREEEEKDHLTKVHKDVNKQVECGLWLSNKFPLEIEAFLTVLSTLSMGGNESL